MGNRKYRLFVLITQNTPTKKENKKKVLHIKLDSNRGFLVLFMN